MLPAVSQTSTLTVYAPGTAYTRCARPVTITAVGNGIGGLGVTVTLDVPSPQWIAARSPVVSGPLSVSRAPPTSGRPMAMSAGMAAVGPSTRGARVSVMRTTSLRAGAVATSTAPVPFDCRSRVSVPLLIWNGPVESVVVTTWSPDGTGTLPTAVPPLGARRPTRKPLLTPFSRTTACAET